MLKATVYGLSMDNMQKCVLLWSLYVLPCNDNTNEVKMLIIISVLSFKIRHLD